MEQSVRSDPSGGWGILKKSLQAILFSISSIPKQGYLAI
jgi:hypothetical protein